MYWADWGSQLALQPQQCMQHCPPRGLRAQEAFCREAHKGLISHLLGGTSRITTVPANGTCVIFSSSGSGILLYLMQLCLLPFLWRWCLFLSVCVDIFYNMRPHHNAFLLGACGRAVCKGCTGCTLRYSRAIKSTTISHISSTRRCLYIVVTSHSAIWPLKAMLLFLREMLFSDSLQCIGTVFHVLSSYLGNKKDYN